MQVVPAAPRVSLRARFLGDHDRLERILGRLIAAFEANDREDIARLWSEFDAGLTAHLDAEDAELLPELARSFPHEAAGLTEEHAQIRARLAELGVALDLHVVRLETARAFIDALHAHAQREDHLLYLWAEQHLSPLRQSEVLRRL